jgi:LPS-assembly protein
MGQTRFVAAVSLIAALLSSVSAAQPAEAPFIEAAETTIDAEQITYDQKTDTVTARGKVVIRRGDTELRADEVAFNRTTSEVDARGNVEVSDPEGTIAAEALQLNLDDETGVLEDATVRSRRTQYSLWGDRVEKGLGQTYRIENGRFTTCRCAQEPQSWSIAARELRVSLDGYGWVKDGTFNVLDVPVLRLPRALFPMQRDRQTGFLIPRFGVSNRRGFTTLAPFYWAISKTQDATLAFDAETRARVGLIGEYRYKLGGGISGLLNPSYFNESFRRTVQTKPFETTVPVNRWSVVGEHVQPLGAAGKGYADVLVVGDDLFLRDMTTYAFDHAHEVSIRTLPFTESHAGVVQQWERLLVNGYGTYYQNLTGGESQTLQRAPEIDVLGQRRFGRVLVGDMDAEIVDFQRGSKADGLRIDLAPGVMVPFPLGRFAFGSARVTLRETYYHLIDRTLVGDDQTVPGDQSRELVEVGAEMGTIFDRVYPFHVLGLEKLKHTIEPQIAYLYIPAVDQGNIPLFDGTDRVNQRNLLTYGVQSRFLGRFAEASTAEDDAPGPSRGPIRELGRLSLMQSVDLTRDINPLQPGRPANHFSDIDIGGRVNPSSALSLRFLTNYATSNNSITATRVGLFVEDPRHFAYAGEEPRLETRTSAGISYRYLAPNFLQEVDGNLVVRLTRWAGVLYSSRYDVVNNKFLDNHFGLRLTSTCDCWALDIRFTDRVNPQEVEVSAQLTLVGFGSSKGFSRVAAVP